MGQPRIKWGQARRYLERRGFEIRSAGGDKIVVGPGADGKPAIVRIGHTSTSNDGTEMLRCYISALKRAYGIKIEDILKR